MENKTNTLDSLAGVRVASEGPLLGVYDFVVETAEHFSNKVTMYVRDAGNKYKTDISKVVFKGSSPSIEVGDCIRVTEKFPHNVKIIDAYNSKETLSRVNVLKAGVIEKLRYSSSFDTTFENADVKATYRSVN